MTDVLFGQLNYEDYLGWSGKMSLVFGEKPYDIAILIQVDEDKETEITNAQRQAYTCFMEKWNSIEPVLVESLINYYNQQEKYSYGPEDEEEAALWWPDINSYEELVINVTPETVIIPPDYLLDKGRRIYLLFDRKWGGDDLDDNGIGVCFLNEQISEIGYKDIAF